MLRIAFRIILATGILSLASLSAHSSAADVDTAVQRVARPSILVIAHRGDSKVAPENTLPAFTSAVQAGADLVELDYYHSADGVPVVFHDKDLDRTTNACQLWGGEKIAIGRKSLAELRMLDAGNWFSAKFSGTRIPTLVEALEAIQAGSMTLIERKGGDPATCIALLKEKNLLDRVVVQAFDWDYLTGCRSISPSVVLAALGDKELTPERLDQIAKTGASIVAWDEKSTNASTIAAIHARGWKAWSWTVDKPIRVAELVAAKIDGIITNRPAQTRAAVMSAQSAK
jgi:glycerophosphoryl diester phosphodiesterase